MISVYVMFSDPQILCESRTTGTNLGWYTWISKHTLLLLLPSRELYLTHRKRMYLLFLKGHFTQLKWGIKERKIQSTRGISRKIAWRGMPDTTLAPCLPWWWHSWCCSSRGRRRGQCEGHGLHTHHRPARPTSPSDSCHLPSLPSPLHRH